jgi:hypothetical protein
MLNSRVCLKYFISIYDLKKLFSIFFDIYVVHRKNSIYN